MLRNFKCPNGSVIPITQCLEKCVRKEGRCLSLPTLYTIGDAREWRGRPSTTQLISPTRMEYLKIVHDYARDPLDSAFALLGTRVHKHLDVMAKKIEQLISEQHLTDADTHGTLDLLEPDELEEGFFKLVDYKTWGAFSVAKNLGIKTFDSDPDVSDATYQLNDYRCKAEALGLPVSRMIIQAIVRDGGTWTAKKMGITENFYMIPVRRLPDDEVRKFFTERTALLLGALESHTLPKMCSYSECWTNNRRCKEYCDVACFCPEGAQLAKIEYQGEGA
jgi:hypothetical protein